MARRLLERFYRDWDRFGVLILVGASTVLQVLLYADVAKRDSLRQTVAEFKATSTITLSPIGPSKPISQYQSAFKLEVLSSLNRVSVAVDEELAYESSTRGLHVVILDQRRGRAMSAANFDIFASKEENRQLVR